MAGFGQEFAPIADEIIEHFGGGLTWTVRQKQLAGSTAVGDLVQTDAQTFPGVRAAICDENIMELDGWRHGDRVLVFSSTDLAGAQLGHGWTAEDDAGSGPEYPLDKVMPMDPGGGAGYYILHIPSGVSNG